MTDAVCADLRLVTTDGGIVSDMQPGIIPPEWNRLHAFFHRRFAYQGLGTVTTSGPPGFSICEQ